MATTYKQGQRFINAQGVDEGEVNFDVNTGRRLRRGESTSVAPVIPLNRLTPTEPITLPQPAYTPTTNNLAIANNNAYGQAQADASYTPPEPEVMSEEKRGLKDYLQGIMGSVGNQAEETNKIYKEEQLAEKKKKAQALSTEMDVMDKAFRDEVKQIRENKEGKFGGAVEQDVSLANDKYQDNRANLALTYKVAAEDYNGAAEIVNQKVQALKDQNAQQMQVYQLYADSINNDLTESEQLELQNTLASKRELAKAKEDAYASVLAQAVQNKAPASVLSAIDTAKNAPNSTIASIYQAAGQYGIDAYKAAQTANALRLSTSGGGASGGGSGSGSGGQYATDLDAMIGTVLSTIPTKFGQQTFRENIAKARNDEDRLNLVAAQVLKGQSAEFKNDFRNQAVGVSQIDKAIALIDEGVKTGALQAATQYTYNLAGRDFDPKLAQIDGLITSAIQPYRNSVTGAAWGEQEEGEYNSLFGSTKYSPTELKQRLVQTKELLKSKSSEGLNAFVNPLGVYDNAFNTGTLAPSTMTSTTPVSQPVQSWFGRTWNWLFSSEE